MKKRLCFIGITNSILFLFIPFLQIINLLSFNIGPPNTVIGSDIHVTASSPFRNILFMSILLSVMIAINYVLIKNASNSNLANKRIYIFLPILSWFLFTTIIIFTGIMNFYYINILKVSLNSFIGLSSDMLFQFLLLIINGLALLIATLIVYLTFNVLRKE